MPSFDALNERIEVDLMHDAAQKDCLDCPNLIVDTNVLGRRVLKCKLYDLVNETYHVVDVPEAGSFTRSNRSAIRAGTFRQIVRGARINKSLRNSRFGIIGDDAFDKSLPEKIAQSPEECPILVGFIEQITNPKTDESTRLISSDPIIRA